VLPALASAEWVEAESDRPNVTLAIRRAWSVVGIPLLESSLRKLDLELPPRGATPTTTLTKVSHGHAKGR
jgi:hypothetical protein